MIGHKTIVTPLGVPHRLMKDDVSDQLSCYTFYRFFQVYEGYFIPKGTTMIPNQYAMASLESPSMKFLLTDFLDSRTTNPCTQTP